MKKIFTFIVLVKLLLVLFVANSYAATVKGAAEVYKVTMTKVELCTSSTGITDCGEAVVIGKGQKTWNSTSLTRRSQNKADTAENPIFCLVVS